MSKFSFANEHPIFKLAHEGNLELLKTAIKQNKRLASLRATNGNPLLFFAAEMGHLNILTYLIQEEGISPDEKSPDQSTTALVVAVFHGHLETVQWLIKEGKASANVKDQWGHTLLLHAAFKGHLQIVKWLIEEVHVPADEKDANGRNAFFHAAHEGQIDIVEWWIKERKSDVNEKDPEGKTALLFAAYNGHLAVVKKLMQEGNALVSERDSNGYTALFAAALEGHTDVVKFLLDQPAVSYWDILVTKQRTCHPSYKYKDIYQLLMEYADHMDAIVKEEAIDIPHDFFCPITMELMIDPVTAPDGYTYEKTAIEEWLKQRTTSPMTRNKIEQTNLCPSLLAKNCIQSKVEEIEKAKRTRDFLCAKNGFTNQQLGFFNEKTDEEAYQKKSNHAQGNQCALHLKNYS